MKTIGEDDVFFDLGVSSLTTIELQLGVEGALGITVPTSELMQLGTIRGGSRRIAPRHGKFLQKVPKETGINQETQPWLTDFHNDIRGIEASGRTAMRGHSTFMTRDY